MRMKRTLFSIVLLAAFAVQGLYAQATREEIFNDIATTGGVYYAYPGPSGIQTKAPKGYEPFYISHYGRHGSRWLIADEDYVRVMEVFEPRTLPLASSTVILYKERSARYSPIV